MDIGFHLGEDTTFYLKKGYNVIAVDADPDLVKAGKIKFEKYIESKQLVLLNYLVSTKKGIQSFYRSKDSAWNSSKTAIANRNNSQTEELVVKSTSLELLMLEYGIPHYCKIDIEGNDLESLQSLKKITKKPQYISVETECLGDQQSITEEEVLATLNALWELGYRYFKLVDQFTLTPLRIEKSFYFKKSLNNLPLIIWRKILNKTGNTYRLNLKKKYNHNFLFGSSGPFGDGIESAWFDFESAKKINTST